MSTQPQKADLVTVEMHTHLGAVYTFPDMDRENLEELLPKLSNRIPEEHGQLQLVNASIALISVPFRILKKILVGGELWWESPNEFDISKASG